MEGEETQDEQEEETAESSDGPDYNYLLSMPMWFLTKEKKDELCKQRDAKVRCCWLSTMFCHVRQFIESLTRSAMIKLFFFFLQMNELNTLKRKSPCDLWKEDLVAFTEELEVLPGVTSPTHCLPVLLQTFLPTAFSFFSPCSFSCSEI